LADLTIGRVAAAAGVNVETIRYYQRRGLMPEPARRRNDEDRRTGSGDGHGRRDHPLLRTRGIDLGTVAQRLELSADGPAHVQRLAFIRRCRSLDMSLDEVRTLLRYLDRPAADCGEVNAVLDEHIEHVARRVRELKVLEKQLRELRAHCRLKSKGQPCGILEELSAERRGVDRARRMKPAGYTHVGAVHGRPGSAKSR
jgi:DNA-binding transcriptional MerR regulator